jgi:hypothetical protein
VAELTDTTDIRETVRERYAADARAAARGAYCEPRALESKSAFIGVPIAAAARIIFDEATAARRARIAAVDADAVGPAAPVLANRVQPAGPRPER